MPHFLQEIVDLLIKNLSVIGSIGKGQKLRVIEAPFGIGIEVDNAYIQGLSRRWKGDSRDASLVIIKKLIKSSIEIHVVLKRLTEIVGISDVFAGYLRQMNVVLDRVPGGLKNMTETYSGDQETVKEIELLIAEIIGR